MNYVLVTEAAHNGTWRFLLTSSDGKQQLIAADSEEETSVDRLSLLSLVRGLESLEGPAHVTLLTNSRYVSQGLDYGLADWRANNWCWERFGKLVPIAHGDLWKRVDHALQFHEVECRMCRFDMPGGTGGPHFHRRRASPLPEYVDSEREPHGAEFAQSAAADINDFDDHKNHPKESQEKVSAVTKSSRSEPNRSKGSVREWLASRSRQIRHSLAHSAALLL